jgi:hypothetical protein
VKDLADLLGEYRLSSPASLTRLMGLMGRSHLRSFLEDLVSYGDQQRGVERIPAGHLALLPAGGWLGLGTLLRRRVSFCSMQITCTSTMISQTKHGGC